MCCSSSTVFSSLCSSVGGIPSHSLISFVLLFIIKNMGWHGDAVVHLNNMDVSVWMLTMAPDPFDHQRIIGIDNGWMHDKVYG